MCETECSAENTNGNCCGLSHKCDENQGDCDSDSDCKDGLQCGDHNCQGFPDSTYDCCYKPCFQSGKYNASTTMLATVNEVDNVGCCQKHCQELLPCEYWTYRADKKMCRLQSEKASTAAIDSSFPWTRGPKYCLGKQAFLY